MARILDEVVASVSTNDRWKLDKEIDFKHRDARGHVIPEHLGRIADSMTDWEGDIADHLGLSEPDRSDIRERHIREPKLQRREALSIWKCRLGSAATYKALIEVFMKAGRLDYAEFVCGLLRNICTSGIHGNMSTEHTRFITSIREKYRDRLINREKQWPHCHSNKLVRLELLERDSYSTNMQRGRDNESVKRSPLAYGNLFKVENGKKPVRKILVEGDAGIGKTTLCISVCEDWAKGEIFEQFELVLHLPLRMKEVASAGSFTELLKLLHSDEALCDLVGSYLKKNEGKCVLVVADGWDELGESKRQEGSFLHQLLFQLFPFMSVIVTSRPSASAPLHELPYIDRFVEVHGFSKEHIIEYIQSEFESDQEKVGRLIEQLKNDPLVQCVCSVPLNSAIVCHLWRTLEEHLPTTMTQLYTKIILNVIVRNIRKNDQLKSIKYLSKFENIPENLQGSWLLLCKFAFQALEKDQLVFSGDELVGFFPEGLALGDKILSFGLLQSAESILATGYGVSFHFVHLTFQEYLAALHLARLSPDEQVQMFQLHEGKSHFKMVWRFFFGIKFDCPYDSKVEVENFDVKLVMRCVRSSGVRVDKLVSVCHWVFEAQNESITYTVLQILRGLMPFNCPYCPRTAHDCASVLYVMSNMQECEDMEINFSQCGARESQIRTLMDILASKERKLQVTCLNLSHNRLTVSGLQALENVVCGGQLCTLHRLYLQGSLTSDADTNSKWLSTFLEALLVHCPDLRRFDVSHNNLGVSGASIYGRFVSRLYHRSSSKYESIRVNLEKTGLGDEGLTAFIVNMESVDISELHLDDNGIHASGVSGLADAICSGKIVMNQPIAFESGLGLSDNPIGLEGAVAVGRVLSSRHYQSESVDLSRCELTRAGGGHPNADSLNLGNNTSVEVRDVGQHLCQIPQNSEITGLILNGNSFTGEGIYILAGFMYMCPLVEVLSTRDCGITSDDLIRVLDKHTSNQVEHRLWRWKLSDNQIDDRGVAVLMHHMPYSLYVQIDLQNNLISNDMMKILEENVREKEKGDAMRRNRKGMQRSLPVSSRHFEFSSIEKLWS